MMDFVKMKTKSWTLVTAESTTRKSDLPGSLMKLHAQSMGGLIDDTP